MLCLLSIVAIAVIAVGYWVLMRPFNYWKSRGVVQASPVPIFGDMWSIFCRTESVPEIHQRFYNSNLNVRYIGMYQFSMPVLLIRDPELIKQITIKDFDHFLDHREFTGSEGDSLLGKSLLALKGLKWRQMRSTLSPAFTSSKMKYMFGLISEIGEQFTQSLLAQNQTIITVEIRELFSRFTSDVIASTVFGYECDSLNDPNNEFYLTGREITDFTSLRKLLVYCGYVIIPRILTFFKIGFFSDKTNVYFTNLLKENIARRATQSIVRPDMINLMLEIRNNRQGEDSNSLPDAGFASVEESAIGNDQKLLKVEITEEDIKSNAFAFFFAGFDSVLSLLSFMSYEVAINPDVQKTLREEIDRTNQSCDGRLTYEAIATMKYLDMVVTETLRKWPNAITTDRVCTKPYVIEPKFPNERPVHLNENDCIYVAMYGIHRDPQYWPDPERFDPERFSDDSKSKIVPGTYIPFGVGVRNCIGSRFALLETKILFFHLLSKFEVIPVKETPIPLKFCKKSFGMGVEKGFWLGLQRRNN